MKKTLNVNIGGMAFVIDEDAYNVLRSYLADIESRIDAGESSEVMGDIESRIAEIFSERINPRAQVVDLGMVDQTTAVIGRPELFGEQRYDPHRRKEGTQYSGPTDVRGASQSLYRSRTDKVLAGVCGGLANYLGVDVTLVRILTLVSFFLSFSITFWVYVILWIVVPKEPLGYDGGGRSGKKSRRS